MAQHVVHTQLPGRLIMLGCGSIGQAALPLILRHLGVTPDRITIVTADGRGRAEAGAYGIVFNEQALTKENYRRVLEPLVGAGDFILNLSVDVSSTAIARLAHERGALYLDTVVEPWGGMYFDRSLSPADRSNYALREEMLRLRRELGRGPTAVSAQGANPGLVSQLLKEAALIVARDTGVPHAEPTDRQGWARLFREVGVKAMMSRITRSAWRRPFRGGTTCSTSSAKRRAPTRSFWYAAARARTAATSTSSPALLTGSPMRVEPDWSTTRSTVSSRSSVKVLT